MVKGLGGGRTIRRIQCEHLGQKVECTRLELAKHLSQPVLVAHEPQQLLVALELGDARPVPLVGRPARLDNELQLVLLLSARER